MRKRTCIVLAILLVAVVGAVVWVVFYPRVPDPIYEGKRLSYWLKSAAVTSSLRSDTPEQLNADAAVRHAGVDAIPLLLQMLKARDSNLKLKLLKLAEKQHLFKIGYVPANKLNWQAALAFRVLRSDASNAVAELIQILDGNDDETACSYSEISLGYIGPAGRAAVPSLLRGLSSTNYYLRYNAVSALGEIHAEPESVLPAFITVLQDPSSDLRAHALSAIGKYGADAKSAVPAVTRLLVDNDLTTREMAQQILKEIVPETDAKSGIK